MKLINNTTDINTLFLSFSVYYFFAPRVHLYFMAIFWSARWHITSPDDINYRLEWIYLWLYIQNLMR